MLNCLEIKTIAILLLLTCGSIIAFAQKQQNVWTFGLNAGVDFNYSPPVAIKTGIRSERGCASISDNKGNLLFYSDGYHVWDRNGNIMPNGNNITRHLASYWPYAYYGPSQSVAIVPIPDSSDKYYVFCVRDTFWGGFFTFSAGRTYRLHYSVVDMSMNRGLGDVDPNRKAILIGDGYSDRMQPIVGNKCNIWLVLYSGYYPDVKYYFYDGVDTIKRTFSAFEISSSGINPNPIISNTQFNQRYFDHIGLMQIAPNRRKIAVSQIAEYGIYVYDFNPTSGIVSNGFLLDILDTSYRSDISDFFDSYYGIEFSPDNSKL